MSSAYDAVLLIGFGGPRSSEEIRPFLNRVLGGRPIPPERMEEVARHYEAVGGRSPFNEITFRQARALERSLKERGFSLPVYVGMRNSTPFLAETLRQMAADGIKRSLGFILAPHQTEASWERYQADVEEARAAIGEQAPRVDYCPAWYNHPLFIQAWSEEIKATLGKIDAEKRPTTPVIFTAHSVPTAMAERSSYVQQIRETASLVTERLNHPRWSVAYQSRSGRPEEPWLEPDIVEVIRSLAAERAAQVVVAPIGFVCDHVEVLYDLDIEARRIAEGSGIRFLRAGCPNDHPTFIAMMADVIEASAKA